MSGRIEGFDPVDVSIDEDGAIIIEQDDLGTQESQRVRITHLAVPRLIKLLEAAAADAKEHEVLKDMDYLDHQRLRKDNH